MLIDFTVSNYRSIKDPVTLSAIAQSGRASSASSKSSVRKVKPDNEIATPFPVTAHGFDLLPAIGIFGANASGKSNVLSAFDEFLNLIVYGSNDRDNSSHLRDFVPFRLDKANLGTPTEFRLRVARDEKIFIYSIQLNQERIISEKFEYIPAPPKRKTPRLIFSRQLNEDMLTYTWKNGHDFGNAYAEIEATIQGYEPFITFIMTRLKVPLVEAFALWIAIRWPGTALGAEALNYKYAVSRLASTWKDTLPTVTEILCRFDTGIIDVEIDKISSDESSVDQFQVFGIHQTPEGRVRLPFSEESTGTQRLFTLIYCIIRDFKWGTLLLIDELGANIHPNITRELVRMFQSSTDNPQGAQLLFTSHDNTLQRDNLLRRDQIWFTEKRSDGSTNLYPLTDFKPRNDLALDRAYLDGRFGAVPLLPSDGRILASARAAENG